MAMPPVRSALQRPSVDIFFYMVKIQAHFFHFLIILGGAFVLLLVFLIVGLLVALYELVSEIKNEPQHGPLGRALKEAFCGCLPPITR